MKKLFKLFYNLVPFKKQIFICLKFFWVPPKRITQHLHFKSAIKVKVDEKASFYINHYGYIIENELFWHGFDNAWEKVSFKLWRELSRDANTIVDIGANTGVYALMSKAINPVAAVYAIEPVERVFKKLQDNIKLNKFNIIALPEAASDKDGSAMIFDIPDTEHTYSVTVNRNMYPTDVPVIQTVIKTVKLDTIVERYNIQRIDLIKIDVETHEPEVLEGYLKYICLHKPTLLIEVLNDEVGQKIEEIVKDLGYLYFNIDEKAGIKKVEHIKKSDYYNYLLCDSPTAAKLSLIN